MPKTKVKRIRGRTLQRIRHEHFTRHPLCVMCLAKVPPRITAARELDHIIALHLDGADTAENRQGLCVECHVEKSLTERGQTYRLTGLDGWPVDTTRIDDLLHPSWLKPSRVPLTIVCGPAAGGKSTYIKQHKARSDLVIDMDAIRKELGIGINQWDADTLKRSLNRRNEILNGLANATVKHAWFIVSAATNTEREWWARALKPSRILIVLASKDVCLERIRDTRSGDRAARSIKAVSKWWQRFDNSSKHEVLETS